MIREHQDGLLDLDLAVDGRGRTCVTRHRQRFPLRTTTAMYLDPEQPGMAFIYIQNPAGGLIEGDRLTTRIVAASDACVHVTTQSATKIHRMATGFAEQRMTFDLGRGAYCEYLPDPLIPQGNSRFAQSVVVQLAEGASFIGGEIVTPGRFASRERFVYSRLSLKTEIKGPAGELFVDALLFEPKSSSPARLGILGSRPYLSSLLVIAPGRDLAGLAGRLDSILSEDVLVLGAAGVLPRGAGVLVRALAPTSILAKRSLLQAWDTARQELTGRSSPRLRK